MIQNLTDAGVELHPEGFSVPRCTRADLIVGGVLLVSVDVADFGLQDARDPLVCELYAPEAACHGPGGGGKESDTAAVG